MADEWSVAQNVHHLVDSHINSYVRCKLMATEEHPPLKPYDEAAWAMLPDGRMGDIEISLRLLEALHERWVIFWRHLDEGQWARTGEHMADGVVSLAWQLELYVAHGAAHVAQMKRVIAALKK